MQCMPTYRPRAFTLVELLTVIGIIAVLIAILLPALSGANRKARQVACLSNLQQIGHAVSQYVSDYGNVLPRSLHSSFAVRVQPWGRALMPYMGYGHYVSGSPRWQSLFNGPYRCPVDPRRDDSYSYGKNVYPELTSLETGGPTWWRVTDIRQPSRTIFFAELETTPGADHVMAHFWGSAGVSEVGFDRHGKTSNYLFIDSHAEALAVHETYDFLRKINLWNPQLAH